MFNIMLQALIHGGLFVLGESKVNSRLSVVYRLLKLQVNYPFLYSTCIYPQYTNWDFSVLCVF